MSKTIKKNIDIDSHYQLTQEQISFYQENEFIKLKNVLSPETLAHYRQIIWDKTLALNTNTLAMEERSTYDKAFIQVINLWQENDRVKEFVLGKTLARIASELMQVSGVRLYHDQALFKEASGGFTPWHADQQYWPLSSHKTITAWIPLQAVSLDMGPLSFAAGSQHDQTYRDLAISDDSEMVIQKAMNDYPIECAAFDIGEISFHSGWMYHRAPANKTNETRGVMTIIYMDEAMKLKEPENPNQENDRRCFLPGIEVGQIANSPLNPIIYSQAF
ncbi:phytanoyl-CoA dioxygenase family protein [Lentisphaera profundi]|uniref:Phytanoyl-CoA dioxygenase family protein n=1 Tax=Lentisphaera profundi TaxID=1658616 RepID=A0ABY7VX89_9BACT|nr:phytanoyl-CoA dioxygenase family protein [Lentisphaera profundi]WDE98536.1 phytanoyl-CoA dioxygenase family protein [Lentisphaera profundi]